MQGSCFIYSVSGFPVPLDKGCPEPSRIAGKQPDTDKQAETQMPKSKAAAPHWELMVVGLEALCDPAALFPRPIINHPLLKHFTPQNVQRAVGDWRLLNNAHEGRFPKMPVHAAHIPMFHKFPSSFSDLVAERAIKMLSELTCSNLPPNRNPKTVHPK